MPISGADKVMQQGQQQLQRIAEISMNIRKAVRSALPAPPEQFFTMMVPGKVLNFNDFTGGYDAKGQMTAPLIPRSVQLAEAILCDDMPALSGVQLGPTGRSVSRSYNATLTKLCPAGHTVGVDDGIDDADLEEAERRYRSAMDWLTSPASPNSTDTRIDRYRVKQTAYTDAFERKVVAFDDALDRAVKDPANNTVALQREAYDKWVAENQKMYNNGVQAAYMDWVTLGKKEEVEYYFAIVDNDSAMARVEASKESMRNSIISDPDGSVEYNKVSLTPSNWAWLAQQKASGQPRGETAESLTYKIARLEKINILLKGMIANPSSVPGYSAAATDTTTAPADTTTPADTTAPANTTTPADSDTDSVSPPLVKAFLAALKGYQDAFVAYEKLKKSDPSNEPDKTPLNTAFTTLNTARDALTDFFTTLDKTNIENLNNVAVTNQAALFADGARLLNAQLGVNKTQISTYKAQLKSLKGTDSATALQDSIAIAAGIPPAAPDVTPSSSPDADYWTSISIEVSSSYNAEQSTSSSNSFSVGGSGSWGLWSVGGSAAHTDSTSDAAMQMANSSVKASFECMRVDITRGWLRGELFYDDDLKVARGNSISPGPIILAGLMDPDSYTVSDENAKLDREAELAKYDLFPMYPTSFLLAANVVLEIEGETSDIQSHFHTSTTSGSASVGWGPFAVTSSFSHTDTQASSSCEATATGCKITIKSPQIIGWISQIVPALPRVKK